MLIPFGGLTECPKCGTPAPEPKYEKIHYQKLTDDTFKAIGFTTKEFLEYTCRCGFFWSTHTKDYKGEENE